MNLLAFDTASFAFSIALSRGNELFCMETQAKDMQSEFAMSHIDSLFKNASLKATDLSGIICMGGPGSFTGLRIGYSIAKGLALSLSIPFVSVPTLDCIAYGGWKIKNENITLLVAVIESGKNSFFYALFDDNKRLTADIDINKSQIYEDILKYKKNEHEKIKLTGNGASAFYENIPQELKDNFYLDERKRNYAADLISIAENSNLFDNDNAAFLYSGPDYVKKTDFSS